MPGLPVSRAAGDRTVKTRGSFRTWSEGLPVGAWYVWSGRLPRDVAALPAIPPSEVRTQDAHVAGVGAPEHVGRVADQRQRPDGHIKGDVADHPGDRRPAHAQAPGLVDQVRREGGAGHVSDAGEQPDQRIEAETDIRTGNPIGRIE